MLQTSLQIANMQGFAAKEIFVDDKSNLYR